MCLAIPGRVLERSATGALAMGRVAFGGIVREICFECLPDAQPGDYVLVHVGFALSRIDEEEAMRIFDILRELGNLGEIDPRQEEAPT
jgi:hydrogenase expression/formation protein HypC